MFLNINKYFRELNNKTFACLKNRDLLRKLEWLMKYLTIKEPIPQFWEPLMEEETVLKNNHGFLLSDRICPSTLCKRPVGFVFAGTLRESSHLASAISHPLLSSRWPPSWQPNLFLMDIARLAFTKSPHSAILTVFLTFLLIRIR